MTRPSRAPHPWFDWCLLGLLAVLWGGSYGLIKVAVAEIPPLTLIAARVSGAALVLGVVLVARAERLPRDAADWRRLLVQSFFNSIGAWTVLAWGQQHVDAGLASVLNSTAPIFVLLATALWLRHERVDGRRLIGALVGLTGVVLIVGVDALRSLGVAVAGQLACLAGALLYACAALYGRRLAHLSAPVTATGTMVWASVVLVPLALLTETPWTLRPSSAALGAAVALSVLCTGLALVIYFRLLKTLGALGTASQAYLRAGIGVAIGVLFLGETLTSWVLVGVVAAVGGVVLINWPRRTSPA